MRHLRWNRLCWKLTVLQAKLCATGFVVVGFTLLLNSPAALASLGTQLAKLTPFDGRPDAWFGVSVDIDSDIAIVGASEDGSSGSAYLFDIHTGTQLAKLHPIDGAAGDEFGISVGIRGNTAIVGAWEDDDQGRDSGSAYLFDAATGSQRAKLVPKEGKAQDGFGLSVGIGSSVAIVGAYGDDDNGGNAGAAYLFDVVTGAQLAKLTASDGGPNERFGWSVGIDDQTAIVGALWDNDKGRNSGSAYLFDLATGAQLHKLTPSDGAAGDEFGSSVAISGNTAIVGAFRDGQAAGSAYLFDVATGMQLAKLTPSDASAGDYFGTTVGINGSTAIVGAPYDTDNGNFSGSAYLFDIATGQQLAKLQASDGAEDDVFSFAVGISDGKAIVGAFGDDLFGRNSGSAYLFDTTIPEPSTLLLGAWMSVEALGLRRRRIAD